MMLVRVFPTAEALARALALDVAHRLAENPDLVLGLPTGRTPIPFYREIVKLHRAGRADFSRAATFNLDELFGLDPRDPRSYGAFMQRQLFEHVNLSARRIHVLNGATHDADRECRRYERAIVGAGGIDLQILGLGLNGHIGLNEPAAALIAPTHRASLTLATRRANAASFDNRAGAVPREALSMGMGTILRAARIVLLATGAAKARCIQRMVEGPVTTRLPASFLQLHRNAELWVDRAAAGNVSATRRARALSAVLPRPRRSRREPRRARVGGE